MYILVDIGGTKTRVAASRDLESFDKPHIFSTQAKYQAGITTIVESAKKLAGSGQITAMSVGVPATLSRDKRSIIGGALNIPDWKGKSIADDLEEKLSTKVYADNDTAIVGLGEAHFGAGRGAEILVYVTVSTGVNGARIVRGAVDISAFGFSTGHQYLSIEETPRTLEQMISGRAIRERFNVHSPKDLGKEHEVWEELARTLAFGLHNSIVHWSPDRIVLGGSMFNEIGIPVDRVVAHIKQVTSGVGESVEIVHSELGDLGGLWGGMARLKQLQ
ncbi:ROK family protein [Candidatus Parcubacteria bacterium]|nr:MAG: ROK family protein [Candidatus Parcubacteria bacterium]